MVKGTLSISYMFNGRFRLIHTAWLPGESLEEVEEAAEIEINEFKKRHKKFDVDSPSVQILLWI